MIRIEMIMDEKTGDWNIVAGKSTDGNHVDIPMNDVTDDFIHTISKLAELGKTLICNFEDENEIKCFKFFVKPIETFDYLKMMM